MSHRFKTTVVCITGLLISQFLYSQKKGFFDPDLFMQTGIYYYPEHWPEDEWERDIRNIASMGFEFIHMAEFAWVDMEPSEGQYTFEWLDKAIELADKYGVKVVLGTPSPTPPAWLTQKYPEVLLTMSNGLQAQHGTRQHVTWGSPKYMEMVGKLVTQMARRYGNDKRVIGWKIDNEPCHYGHTDFNPVKRRLFIEWLKEKYGDIASLNYAWGTAFWGGTYSSFDEIELPNPDRLINGTASVTSRLDFHRFNSNELATFLNFQAEILRKYANNQWITTNAIALLTEFDAFRFDKLDFLSFTIYPVIGFPNDMGENGFRTGNYLDIMRNSEYVNSFSGTSGCMEIQPGQINWAPYNVQLLPGTVHTWLWHLFALNQSFSCSYRYRQPLYGGEQYHYGMVGTDGITKTAGGREYEQFAGEMRELRKNFKPGKNPPDYENRRTGYLINYDNTWSIDISRQTSQWNIYNYRLYHQLKKLAVPVDFIEETSDFSKYKVLVAPYYEIVDDQIIKKWTDYVEGGGNLVLTCRTGHKDRNGWFWKDKWAAPVTALIGGGIDYFDLLPSHVKSTIEFQGRKYEWNNWGDILTAYDNTEIWATHTDQFYSGKPVILHRKLGKGTVTYIGVDTNDGELEKQVLNKVFGIAGLKTNELPNGVFMEYRDGFGVAVNYHTETRTVTLPKNAKIIFGKPELKTLERVVWRE